MFGKKGGRCSEKGGGDCTWITSPLHRVSHREKGGDVRDPLVVEIEVWPTLRKVHKPFTHQQVVDGAGSKRGGFTENNGIPSIAWLTESDRPCKASAAVTAAVTDPRERV